MDYEKKYKEALERAKKWLYAPNSDKIPTYANRIIEGIFPELKESKAEWVEKIRKELKDYLGKRPLKKLSESDTVNQWIAWLEKQGEPIKLSEEERNRFAKGVLSECAMSFINYLDSNKREGKMCVSNMECEDIENAFHNGMWDRLYGYHCKYIEKQDEQKSADKVGPKREPKKASCNNYKKIIEHYGVRNQLKKLSEEVYELQEAVIEEDLLCGVNGCNNKNITEEIADVFVILRQLVMQFDIAENDIEDMADYKVKRTLERIKKEK